MQQFRPSPLTQYHIKIDLLQLLKITRYFKFNTKKVRFGAALDRNIETNTFNQTYAAQPL